MKQFAWMLLLAVVLAFAGAASAAKPAKITVTPAWLADHLDDPKLVVLHVASMRADYTREHIPGARFLWPSWLVVSTPELGYEMVPTDTLGAVMGRLGISKDSEVVLCHVLGDVATTARVYVTLDYLGMGDRTRILDGGLAAWKSAGFPLTKEEPAYTAVTFVPRVQRDVVVHLDAMRSLYASPGIQVLDGRSRQDFDLPEGPSVFRGGHIPGAINLPYVSLFDSLDRYQPLDSLAARFEKAGVKPGGKLVTYCNAGRTACPAFVAARMLGYDVRLYDGSFQEWSRREELPVEHSSEEK